MCGEGDELRFCYIGKDLPNTREMRLVVRDENDEVICLRQSQAMVGDESYC